MRFYIYYHREFKKCVVIDEDNYPVSGYTKIGSFKHSLAEDSIGPKVNHVIYHHVKALLYPTGAHDMAYHHISQYHGTAGDVSSISFDTIAQESISAFKVIWQSDHDLADSLDTLRLNEGIGITTQTVTQGLPFELTLSGVVTNTLWNWLSGKPIYLDHDGEITQLYTTGAKLLGNAITSDTIYFNPSFLSEQTQSNVIEVISPINRSGHKIVFLKDLAYVSPSNTSRMGELIGLTRNGVLVNDSLSILLEGPIVNSLWNFVPGAPIYVGINGSISNTGSTSGLYWNIGNAINETTIFFNPQPPVLRS